jgi:hypothetical protein
LSCAVYQRTLNQESTTRLKNFASGSKVGDPHSLNNAAQRILQVAPMIVFMPGFTGALVTAIEVEPHATILAWLPQIAPPV